MMGAVRTRPEVSYLPAYVALERWLLAKRVAVLSPSAADGPRRLATAGARRVLVLGTGLEPSQGVEVWAGPLATPLRLPLRDASVDAVLCIEGYAGLADEDRTALAEEARRVLRPTGVLALWCADLPATEALLRPVFPQVAALAQRRWTAVSLAPVADTGVDELRRVEDLVPSAATAGPFLVLAAATELAPVVRECVLIATESPVEPTSPSPVDAASPPAQPEPEPEPESEPPATVAPRAAYPNPSNDPARALPVVLPVRTPVPPLGQIDESDVLAALFDPAPEPEPESAPTPQPEVQPGVAAAELAALQEQVIALTRERDALREPQPEAKPEVSAAELVALQEQVAALTRERDGLRERSTTLAQELRHAHAQAIDAGAELHELRRRVDSQRANLEEAAAPMLEHTGPNEAVLLSRVLVDEVAPIVAPEAPRPTADVVIDRDRLREELSRRTADLQALETRLWESEEEVQRERLENVRLVTDVDRLREQVDRSRVVEHERMMELERLGHELRRLEVAYAELQGLYTTSDHRLRELEARANLAEDHPEIADLEEQLREMTGERDQALALEKNATELVRRRERELADASRTIRELRRSVEEHASVAANLRGELAVMQIEVEQYGASVPGLQERLRDQQRKTAEREEEAADLQRRLEEAVAEQQQLRQRLRRYKQELEALMAAKEVVDVDLDRMRGELDAKRRAVEQLQQLLALGAGSGRGTGDDDELQALRALLAQQAGEHAEALQLLEQQQRQALEQERERLQRIQLEATIRGEEQEYLLYQLDTAEQRIWEMTDATDRSAARLAAGLAQLEKQKEQYEDLIDQLEVARTLLAEAQAKIVELERQQASDKAKLARLTLEPGVQIDVEDDDPADLSGFDVMVEDRDEDSGMEVAPQIQRDPNLPDPLAGIDFDEDEESIAVRLAGSSFEITGAFPAAGMRIDLDDDERGVMLPSDSRVRIDLDDDDEDEGAEPDAPRPRTPPRRAPLPKVLRTLPFLEDDDDMFSIDTDAIEIATPTPPPPPPDRPGFDQKLTDHSNSRIVIEILDDEAWPEDEDQKT